MNNKKSCNPYFASLQDLKNKYFYLAIICIVLSFVALYFALTNFIAGLIMSAITIIASIFLYKKIKTTAMIAVVLSLIAFIISLLIFLVNVLVY